MTIQVWQYSREQLAEKLAIAEFERDRAIKGREEWREAFLQKQIEVNELQERIKALEIALLEFV